MMEGQAAVMMPVIKNSLGLLLMCTATKDWPCDQGKHIWSRWCCTSL